MREQQRVTRRKRGSKGWLKFLVFVMLIVVGGIALNATGYTDSPFDEIAFLSSWVNGGENQFEQALALPDNATSTTFTLPSVSDTNSDSASAVKTGIDLTGLSQPSSQFSLSSASDTEDLDSDEASSLTSSASGTLNGDDQSSIVWSDIGDVLYNFWFICAVTAVFIVVQQGFKFAKKQLKGRQTPSAVAVH